MIIKSYDIYSIEYKIKKIFNSKYVCAFTYEKVVKLEVISEKFNTLMRKRFHVN